MSQPIDILIIDPSDSDAKRTVTAIRRKAPKASTLRVSAGNQAERLMFERGLFTEAPQMPSLIIVDLAAAGECVKTTLRRLKACRLDEDVPVVIFSARRSARDILDSHMLGAHLNIIKPTDPNDYAAAVERMIALWLAGSFMVRTLEAC
jgi:DNA-binding response OmpR family regulator